MDRGDRQAHLRSSMTKLSPHILGPGKERRRSANTLEMTF